jgi:hypothetical protein
LARFLVQVRQIVGFFDRQYPRFLISNGSPQRLQVSVMMRDVL